MVVREAWREEKRKLKDNIKVGLNINRTYGRGMILFSYCRILWTGEWKFGVYKNGEWVKKLSGYLLIKSGVPHLSEWVKKIRYNTAIVRNVLFYKDTTTTTRQLRLNTLRWHIINRWQHWNCKFFVFCLFSAGFSFSGHISATKQNHAIHPTANSVGVYTHVVGSVQSQLRGRRKESPIFVSGLPFHIGWLV
jgi:hypothetical protein